MLYISHMLPYTWKLSNQVNSWLTEGTWNLFGGYDQLTKVNKAKRGFVYVFFYVLQPKL